jgi:hypothetical protein
VKNWVTKAPDTPSARLELLRTMFVRDECNPELQPVGKQGVNLICTLPGETKDVVVIAADYDADRSTRTASGAVQNWSGAAMLPLLFRALQATKRQNTFIFIALAGSQGAEVFLKSRNVVPVDQLWSRTAPTPTPIRAIFHIEDLGLSSTSSCSYPDIPARTLQNTGLAVAFSEVGKILEPSAATPQQNCRSLIKSDDTKAFRKDGIPVLTIHSIQPPQQGRPDLDRLSTIDPARFYASFEWMANYLCLLDKSLDDVLSYGSYNPARIWGSMRPDGQAVIELPADFPIIDEPTTP